MNIIVKSKKNENRRPPCKSLERITRPHLCGLKWAVAAERLHLKLQRPGPPLLKLTFMLATPAKPDDGVMAALQSLLGPMPSASEAGGG